MRLPGLGIDDAELGQSAFPLRHDDVIRKETHTVDLDRRVVIDEDRPVLLRRVIDRRGHDLEVLGALVGRDVEEPVVVIDAVLVLRLARQDDLRRCAWRISREVAHFGRGLGVTRQKDHFLVERTLSTKVEELALLLVDEIAAGGTDLRDARICRTAWKPRLPSCRRASCCPLPRRPSQPARCSPRGSRPCAGPSRAGCTAGSRSYQSSTPASCHRR